MAAGDPYISCDASGKQITVDSSVLQMLNALAVKTAAGKYGFRAVRVSTAAANITPLVGCGEPLKELGELMGWVIVQTASGKPAIGLIEEA